MTHMQYVPKCATVSVSKGSPMAQFGHRYEVVRPLGKGGAGGVFLVRDRLRGGEQVALKAIDRSGEAGPGETIRASIEREFSVLSALSLPGVAPVFDFGTRVENGVEQVYFTRAHVMGTPLDRSVDGMPMAQKWGLTASVCATVAALHRAKVVHGDLKPANIIIDGTGAQLIDFGLAHSHRDPAVWGGTPAYMAPEQWRGASPNQLTDVYALAATLWHLWAGSPPPGPSSTESSSTEPRLNRAPTGTPADVDPQTAEVLRALRAGLEEDPLKRSPTVGELWAGIQQAVVGWTETQKKSILEDTATPTTPSFVPPSPRQLEDHLAWLLPQLSARPAKSGQPVVVRLAGAEGSGKSTLLRRIKWHLQLKGAPVMELPSSQVVAEDARAWIQEQWKVHQGEQAGASPWLLVDDADARDGALGAWIDSFRQEHGLDCVVACTNPRTGAAPWFEDRRANSHGARSTGEHSIGESAPREGESWMTLPPLGLEAVTELCEEVLGHRDHELARALHRRCEGNPGQLVGALGQLASRHVVTVEDVEHLAMESLADSRARTQIQALPPEQQFLLQYLHQVSLPLPWNTASILLQRQCEISEPRAEHHLQQLRDRGWMEVRARDRGQECMAAHRSFPEAVTTEILQGRAVQVLAVLKEQKQLQTFPLLAATWSLLTGDMSVALEYCAPLLEQLVAQPGQVPSRQLQEFLNVWNGHGPSLSSSHLPTHGRVLPWVRVAALQHSLGQYEGASRLLKEILAQDHVPPGDLRLARLERAKGLLSQGHYDAAESCLEQAVADAGPVDSDFLPQCAHELAKVHLRRGDYAQAETTASEGLAKLEQGVASQEPSKLTALQVGLQMGLHTTLGTASSYRLDHDRALEYFERAAALASTQGTLRQRMQAMGFLAFGHQRAGNLEQAGSAHAACLDLAQQVGDLGAVATYALNLGTVEHLQRHFVQAEQSYRKALRYARKLEKTSTWIVAQNNLAKLLCVCGAHQQATQLAQQSLEQARQAGLKPAAAQALSLLGDASLVGERYQDAVVKHGEARVAFEHLEQWGEALESRLDRMDVQLLLLEQAPEEQSSSIKAALRVDIRSALERVKAHPVAPEVLTHLQLTQWEIHLACGDRDPLQAVEQLKEVQGAEDPLKRARAHFLVSRAHLEVDNQVAAAKYTRMAVEQLEEFALALPPSYRGSFWHHPVRRRIRKKLQTMAPSQSTTAASPAMARPGSSGMETTMHHWTQEAKNQRLLEILKQLASEDDVQQLLQRIVESAVELAGAERGFLLLVDEQGKLSPQVVHQRTVKPTQAHLDFSRSVAESVLIDGEPLLTMDAQGDQRLSDYVSVHELMLKSIACIPVRGRTGNRGVLYLEHRVRSGRFQENELGMLLAFSDQAAIAMENATAMAEAERRNAELARLNQELQQAQRDLKQLLVDRTDKLSQSREELDRLRARTTQTTGRHHMVGRSEAMNRVFAMIDRVGPRDVPVVIHGESGTGKELLAQALHDTSARVDQPFVVVNCAAIPEALLESELFGHVRGAFTGASRDRAGLIAQASGGTLFLDEVGDMPSKMQVDLLRVLQNGEITPVGSDRVTQVDVRVIAASHKRLEDLVKQGEFREDLFYRLNVVEIALPPLRDREGDLPLLCDHLLERMAHKQGTDPKVLSPGALQLLARHPLPGNVRQLEHLLMNAAIMGTGAKILPTDLALGLGDDTVRGPTLAPDGRGPNADSLETLDMEVPQGPDGEPIPRASTAADFQSNERELMIAALNRCGWNRAKAARHMGMPRRTFYRRLKTYQLLDQPDTASQDKASQDTATEVSDGSLE